jgi:hypothetical protein
VNTEPVQLHNPHGRRYAPQDREATYQRWKVASGRSLRKTARLTGVSLCTLSNWSQEDQWPARAKREDEEDAQSLRSALRGLSEHTAIKERPYAYLRSHQPDQAPSEAFLERPAGELLLLRWAQHHDPAGMVDGPPAIAPMMRDLSQQRVLEGTAL